MTESEVRSMIQAQLKPGSEIGSVYLREDDDASGTDLWYATVVNKTSIEGREILDVVTVVVDDKTGEIKSWL